MSNVTFAKSVDAFVSAQKKGEGAFGYLVMFAQECVSAQPATFDAAARAKGVDAALKNEETAYRAEHPKLAEMPASYRSAKSVIMSAIKAGVALVDEAGVALGKSALEKATKDAKGDTGKSELDKFKSTMNTANAIFAKLDTLHDIAQARDLVAQLADAVVKAHAAAVSAAASSK